MHGENVSAKANTLLSLLRSSHARCSIKKGVLRNFAKFTGKTFVPESPF